MPIKPENKARYPRDWLRIRTGIVLRARNCCEWSGCGARNGAVGWWHSGRFVDGCGRYDITDPRHHFYVEVRGHKLIRIVLTVAHLDHTPEHCEPENLRAWCQRHHLAYDHQHHLQTAYMTRRAARQTMELPL